MVHRFALLFVLTAGLAGCDSNESPQSAVIIDSWYREVDNPAHEFIKYPSYLYRPVIESLVPEAVEALGDGPLLQLSTSEAERYAGTDMHMPMELRPFLIHGLTSGSNVFTVYMADRALWVDQNEPLTAGATVRRQPLVIFIDEVPPDVYVTLGGAAEPPTRE